MVLKGTAQTGTNSQMAPPRPPSPTITTTSTSTCASATFTFFFRVRQLIWFCRKVEIRTSHVNWARLQFQLSLFTIPITPSCNWNAIFREFCWGFTALQLHRNNSNSNFKKHVSSTKNFLNSNRRLLQFTLLGVDWWAERKQPLQSNPTSILGNTHFCFRKYLFPFWEIPISLLGNPYFTLGSTLFPFWEIPASALGNTCFQCLSRVKPDKNKTWTAFFYLHLRQSLTKARDNASCQRFFHVGNVSGLAVALCKGPLQVPLRSLQWDPAPRLHRRNMTCLQTVS